MSEWTREDVEHLDILIAGERDRSSATALPGAEHVRNRIAREVGIEPQPEGGITWETVRETEYGEGGATPEPSEAGLA